MASKKKVSGGAGERLGRLLFVLCLTVILLVVIFLRVAYIKVKHGEEYQKMAEQQQVNSTDVTIPALRGSIMDRHGNVLAKSSRVYNVIMDCQTLIESKEALQISTIEQLMQTLGLESEEPIRKYMTSEYQEYRYLKLDQGKGISVAQMEEIQKGIDRGKVVGIWFEEAEDRQYINDTLAAHVIGFDGTYGVEQYYNEYLEGVQGRKMVVAGTGNSFIEEYIAAENGKNLTLTIDSKVQYYMEQVLQEGVAATNAVRGCAICMNPKTGEIYGMVVMPTFNLNEVTELVGMSEKYLKRNTKPEPADIWTNFAISYTYEPGSTFKPMFASAALNEGVITTQTPFVCSGVYQVYEQEVQCAGKEVHGNETVADIIRNSCNTGMTQISLNFGVNKWLQYQEAYGFAQLTGIDLAGEGGDSRDLIYLSPDDEEAIKNPDRGLGPFEKATTAFGQGFNMTPIQLITAFSSVINGGEYLKPYVVSQIADENGNVVENHTKEILRYTISDEVSKEMRQYMYGTVSSGTGTEAQVDGYIIGGKTGTAEKTGTDDYVVSFIGFTPVDDPEVVMLVVLDETDNNVSSEAAHIASQMFEKVLPALGLYPDGSIDQGTVTPPKTDDSSSTAADPADDSSEPNIDDSVMDEPSVPLDDSAEE